MANIMVQETTGNDSNTPANTFAGAMATLGGADAIDAAGDFIFVSSIHSEESVGALAYTFAGSVTSPTKVYSVSNSSNSPSALTAGASVASTGGAVTIGGNVDVRGMTFAAGVGLTIANLSLGTNTNNVTQAYHNCTLSLPNTHANSRLAVGTNSSFPSRFNLKNTEVSFGSASQSFNIQRAIFNWKGGGIKTGSAAVTQLFRTSGVGAVCRGSMEGLDLSAGASTMALVNSDGTAACDINLVFRNIKMPAGWSSANLVTGTLIPGMRVAAYNVQAGAAHYDKKIVTYPGTLESESTIVRTGGGSDGTTGLSWKVTTSANCNKHLAIFTSDEIAVKGTAGVQQTVTVRILHDSLTALKNDQVWAEVQYLGSSGSPASTIATSQQTNPLGTGTNLSASAATWTTTGLTNPNAQEIVLTFTPQQKGYYYVVVRAAEASKVFYIDTKV